MLGVSVGAGGGGVVFAFGTGSMIEGDGSGRCRMRGERLDGVVDGGRWSVVFLGNFMCVICLKGCMYVEDVCAVQGTSVSNCGIVI